MSATGDDARGRPRRKRMEIFAFLFLTAVLMPALAVATVGGYGLAVWIYQILAGPPRPPVRGCSSPQGQKTWPDNTPQTIPPPRSPGGPSIPNPLSAPPAG